MAPRARHPPDPRPCLPAMGSGCKKSYLGGTSDSDLRVWRDRRAFLDPWRRATNLEDRFFDPPRPLCQPCPAHAPDLPGMQPWWSTAAPRSRSPGLPPRRRHPAGMSRRLACRRQRAGAYGAHSAASAPADRAESHFSRFGEPASMGVRRRECSYSLHLCAPVSGGANRTLQDQRCARCWSALPPPNRDFSRFSLCKAAGQPLQPMWISRGWLSERGSDVPTQPPDSC